MRAIILKHMLADLQGIGFVRQGKNLVLKSPETTQTIILDILSLDFDEHLKTVRVYDDVEDNKHAKAKDIPISLGIEFEKINSPGLVIPTKEYVFDNTNVDYEHSQLHKDIQDYGLKFFEAMKSTDNYFRYLLGELFRYRKEPIGSNLDQQPALLALDLALKYKDQDKIERALEIINISLRNGSNRSGWIRRRESLKEVADRIYTPATKE